MMNEVLHIVSVASSFCVVFGILYCLQKYTIGKLPVFKDVIILRVVSLKDVVFIITSLLFIYHFVGFSSQYHF